MERKEKRYKESREFNIFCNYGVIGKEKKKVYTFGAPHEFGICSDCITVRLPENDWYHICESVTGELFVESSWGWIYGINEILLGDKTPCFFALDKEQKERRVFLLKV